MRIYSFIVSKIGDLVSNVIVQSLHFSYQIKLHSPDIDAHAIILYYAIIYICVYIYIYAYQSHQFFAAANET